jgi:hypothetical protein
MTYKHSTADHGKDLLTWYLEDSHARTSAQPERAQESKASEAVCGNTWRESSVKFDLNTLSWKTHQCLWEEVLPSSSLTLPKWGMMRSGVLWERITSPPLTNEKESGSWPTPCTRDYKGVSGAGRQEKKGNPQDTLCNAVAAKMWPTPKASAADPDLANLERSATGISLQTAVALWPTPTVCGQYNRKGASKNSGDGLATVVRRYPTPGANEDSYRLNGNSQQSNSLGAIARSEALAESPESGGQLNPTWVEWLMGWPLGWTDCAASVTAKYREWCRSHGIFSHDNAGGMAPGSAVPDSESTNELRR